MQLDEAEEPPSPQQQQQQKQARFAARRLTEAAQLAPRQKKLIKLRVAGGAAGGLQAGPPEGPQAASAAAAAAVPSKALHLVCILEVANTAGVGRNGLVREDVIASVELAGLLRAVHEIDFRMPCCTRPGDI